MEMGPELPYLKWAEQIAEALSFIHSKGVIHCDLRSPNILVTDTDDIVLADFASALMDGTRVSKVSNKARYRLPEYDQPDHRITVQEDLFAFGTVVYNLITGKTPHEDRYDDYVIELYAQDIFPDVSTLAMG
jgi:serine/threonine protein kinase